MPDVSSAVQAAIELINRESLSIQQAADIRGVSAAHMWRLIRAGRIPSFKVAGFHRIWRDDVPRKAAS